jgi:hypothetical protein
LRHSPTSDNVAHHRRTGDAVRLEVVDLREHGNELVDPLQDGIRVNVVSTAGFSGKSRSLKCPSLLARPAGLDA